MGRTRLGIAGSVVVAAALGTLYLALRHGPGARLTLEAAAVLALLIAAVAAVAVRLTRRHYRRALRDLAEQVADCRDAPPGRPARPGAPEWAPLVAEIDALAAAHWQALTEVVATQEALENFRGLAGLADAEKGYGHSFIRGKSDYLRSKRLVARLGPDLRWQTVTAGLQRFVGRPLAELIGHSFLDAVAEEDAAALARRLKEALREGEAHDVTFRLLLGEGEVRHVQMDVLTRYNADGSPLHLRCHFVDVTDRVRAERDLRVQSARLAQANAALRQSNAGLERLKESYRDLYHQAPVLYFSLDARGRFAACNDTLLAAVGYARADLLGQPYTRLLTPEGARRFLEGPGAYARHGEVEARWVKRDGTVIDVWVRTAPILDEHGKFVRSRSAAQDVTERNRLAGALRGRAEELRQANDRLRRINQELEEFTYVVSHDLKEPLRTLEAFSTFLSQDYGAALGEEGSEYINHLVEASRRLGRLIDDLLALGRAGKVLNTPAAFDLGEVAQTAIADLSDLIHRTGARVRVEGPLPAALGDRERVAQLLTNLIGNGLKYNRSARPEVVIGHLSLVPGPWSNASDEGPGTRDQGRVTIFVRDNGIGIDPAYHEQVFRLFRRLHRREEFEGTGAGLAICKKIVEAHGGRIRVESAPGQGATFYFTLPCPSSPAPRPVSEGDGREVGDEGQGARNHAAPAAR